MANLCAETNAVLKLELGEQGGTRRIALKKLWDESTSTVSYQRLVNMALKYKEITKNDIHPSEYHVTVTYNDEDGDCITISTDDELAEAFEQFTSKVPPVLRAKASVMHVGNKDKKKNKKNRGEQKEEYLNTLRQAVSDIDETAKKNGPSSTTTTGNTKPVEQMHNALESFVTILGQAVDTLQKNVEMVQQKKKERENRRNSKRATASAAAAHVNEYPGFRRCSSSDSNVSNSKEQEGRTESEKKVLAKKLMKEAVDAVNAKKKEEEEPVVPKEEKKKEVEKTNILPVPPCFDREFIHGRHTCDGCLVTPIVGIRYHALNMPDHDLCEKCVKNYKGKDMLLEPTQLERDRYLQTRWKRRQNRIERQQRCRQTQVRSCRFPPKKNNKSIDIELDMAIRRSLLDLEKKEQQQQEQPKQEEKKEPVQEEAKVEPKEETVEVQAEVPPAQECSEEEQAPVEDTVVEESEQEVQVPSSPVESTEEKEDTPVTDTPVTDEDVAEEEEEEKVTSEPVVEEEIEVPALEEVVEVKVEVPVTEDKEIDQEANEDKVEEKEEVTERDFSFSDDAQGQGDVAIAIGNALDEYADAIDAVVSEVKKNEKCLESADSVDSDIEAGCTIIESANGNDGEDGGDVILDGASTASSKDSWQFLDEDGELTSDEMIAHAAQILGSALFQSDIEEKEASNTTTKMEDSELTDPSAFNKSSVSSVPTSVDSIFSNNEISPVVLSRWATELQELHEMGFLDDHRSIEALEHLQAANIGVDSDESVTVAQVVNFLLANHK